MAQDQGGSEATTSVDRTGGGGATAARVQRGGLRTFSSLQNNRDYRFLFTGTLSASAAHWLQFVAIGWFALDITGSVFHSIMAVSVRSVPVLALGPWGGVMADRWDRRKLAMGTQVLMAVSAFVFATLVVGGQVNTVWHLYAYTGISGIGFAINSPVRQALVANTVRRTDMANALALHATTATSMRLTGAAIGGILLATVAIHWNFYLESVLYVGMILLLIPMRTPYQAAGTARRSSPMSNLKEGLSYMFGHQIMRRLLLVNFIRTGIFMPLLLLLPSYTFEALHRGPGVSTAMIVSMGIGGLVTSLIISTWGFFTKKGLVCLITLFTGSAVVFTVGMVPWVWLVVPIMAMMGISQTNNIVANQTLIQLIVPDALRGRVSSVWQYESGLTPLFSLMIAAAAAIIGIAAAMAWAGGIAMALSLFFIFRYKDVRETD